MWQVFAFVQSSVVIKHVQREGGGCKENTKGGADDGKCLEKCKEDVGDGGSSSLLWTRMADCLDVAAG